MTLYEIISNLNMVLLAVSLVVFARMAWAGRLSEKYLRLGPTRELKQPREFYLFGIFGVMVYAVVKLQTSPESPLELQFAIYLVPFLFVGLLLNRAIHTEAGFRTIGLLPRHPRRDLSTGLFGGILGYGLAGLSGFLTVKLFKLINEPVPQIAHESLVSLQEDFNPARLIVLFVTAVIAAPLIEETVFRGVLQTSLMRWMKGQRWIAIILSAAVFSSIHAWVVPTHSLVPLFVLGIVWGYLYERTGSLLAPILAHAVFNAANIGIALCMPEQLPPS